MFNEDELLGPFKALTSNAAIMGFLGDHPDWLKQEKGEDMVDIPYIVTAYRVVETITHKCEIYMKKDYIVTYANEEPEGV